jgi:hypothetical protein
MKMSALQIGLIAVAGLMLLRYMGAVGASKPSSADGGAAPKSPPATPSPSEAEAKDLKDLKTALLAAAGAGLHNYDEWNYYYNAIKGTYGPSFEDVMGDKPRSYKMSVDEFMSLLVQKGVSGLLAWG